MNMFDKYDNLSPDYIPNNSSNTVQIEKSVDDTFPLEVYNKKGEFIGYAFNQGDTLDIETGLVSLQDGITRYLYDDYEAAQLNINDFRYNAVYTFELAATQDKIHIDKYTSTLIKQGVYNVEVYVYSKDRQRLATKYKLIVNGGESISLKEEEDK